MSGCTQGNSVTPPGAAAASLRGTVHGGQQPVAGASIQIYVVGSNGDGSAATPLIATPVLSASDGTFSLAGDFTCPTVFSMVYLVASGGNPGLSGGQSNPQLVEMAALGQCIAISSSTFVSVSEVTTVAAVYSLAPYMTGLQSIGSGTSDQVALSVAFTLANQLANIASGTAPGASVPTGETVPVAQIDTVADIVATCINSAGGQAGDGSPCGNLFALTTPSGATPPTNVAGALLDLAQNPTLNTAALYALSSTSPPFQPMDTIQPPNFAIAMLTGLTPLTVSVSAPATTLGQAAISAALSSPSATGTIDFFSSQAGFTNNLATVPVIAGSASYELPYYPAGSYNITAVYSGDNTFATGSSLPVTLTIEPALTSTSLASHPANGAPVTLTATVSGPSSGTRTLPTGTVFFRDSPSPPANAPFYPRLVGFGDSIMTGNIVTSPADAFFNILATYFPPGTSTNAAQGGDQAADLALKVFLGTPLGSVNTDSNPVTLIEDGANDFLFCNDSASGTPGCLGNYTAANLAAATWLAIPPVVLNGSSSLVTKLVGQSCLPSVGWANSATTQVAAIAIASTTQGSTLTCNIASTGGPIYVSWEAFDTSSGTMNVSIDGVFQGTLNSFGFNGQTISTENGANHTVFATRYPVSAGSHQVVFTVTSPTATANLNSVVSVATPPPAGLLPYGGPRIVVMGVLQQYGGATDAVTGLYNSAVLGISSELQADGLNVIFADTRDAVNDTTDMAPQSEGVHPDDAGHAIMAQVLLPLVQPAAPIAVILGSATLTGNTAQLTLDNLASGNHFIIATYEGDGNFAPSASAAVTVTQQVQSSTGR